MMSCNAVSVDFIRRASIWVSGKSACVSAKKRRRFEITASSAFPRVFNSAIDLYTFGLE